MIDLAGHAPPVLHSFLARALYSTRLFNLTITNVPGPQIPLYAFGSRMRAIWPLVPLAAEHALGLAVFSYDGRLFFCFNGDPESVPELDEIAESTRHAVDELLRLARSAAKPGRVAPDDPQRLLDRGIEAGDREVAPALGAAAPRHQAPRTRSARAAMRTGAGSHGISLPPLPRRVIGGLPGRLSVSNTEAWHPPDPACCAECRRWRR